MGFRHIYSKEGHHHSRGLFQRNSNMQGLVSKNWHFPFFVGYQYSFSSGALVLPEWDLHSLRSAPGFYSAVLWLAENKLNWQVTPCHLSRNFRVINYRWWTESVTWAAVDLSFYYPVLNLIQRNVDSGQHFIAAVKHKAEFEDVYEAKNIAPQELLYFWGDTSMTSSQC